VQTELDSGERLVDSAEKRWAIDSSSCSTISKMNNEHNRCGNEKRRCRRCRCEIVELDRCRNVDERWTGTEAQEERSGQRSVRDMYE